jgi:uncharacterized protein (TIGR02001 family)
MLSKTTYVIRTGVAAALVGGALAAAPAAHAVGELAASAAVSNMYLWRGIDLGDGSAGVSGDLTYSIGGAYAGIWVSSGDDSLGNEYDLYVGYGAELGDFSFDISLWNYNYSDNGLADKGFDRSDDTTGELSEIITTVGFKGISLSYYDNIAGATGYEYWTLSGGIGKVSLTAGLHDADGDNDMTHVDLSYAFNDRISFTASKVVDQDLGKNDDGAFDEDVKFVVAYSLPIEI